MPYSSSYIQPLEKVGIIILSVRNVHSLVSLSYGHASHAQIVIYALK